MKYTAGLFFLVIIIIFIPLTSAQYNPAFQFLTFPVSPVNAGMGSVGTALPTDNVYGFLYNPAQLGYASRTTNLSLQFYMRKPEVSKIYYSQEYLVKIVNSAALNAGYNFESLLKIPVSIGIGYSNAHFKFYDYASHNLFTVEGSNAYNAFSIGAGINYYINFSAGITFKSISSKFADSQLHSADSEENSGVNAYDFGILAELPIFETVGRTIRDNIRGSIYLIPSLDFSIGYSQTNIGDDVSYGDHVWAYQLPRIVRAGYGVSAGIRLSKEIYDIELFHLDFGVEAEDFLGVRDSTGRILPYQGLFGDISLGKNILGIKGDKNVSSHSGVKIGLLESVEFMWGHIGNQRSLAKTSGFVLHTKGLFRYMSDQRNNEMMNFIADHIDIRYYDTKYLADAPQGTLYRGIELVFSNYLF